jgi:hypothetical protein
MTGFWLVSYVVLWVLVLVLTVALISTLRNLGVVYGLLAKQPRAGHGSSRRTALDTGQELPEVRWYTSSGEARSPATFRGGKTAFAIVSPACESCGTYLEILAADGADPIDPEVRDLVVVSLGTPEETDTLLSGVAARTGRVPPLVLFDRDAEVISTWGVSATPATVVVDEELRVVRQVFGGVAAEV